MGRMDGAGRSSSLSPNDSGSISDAAIKAHQNPHEAPIGWHDPQLRDRITAAIDDRWAAMGEGCFSWSAFLWCLHGLIDSVIADYRGIDESAEQGRGVP